MNFIKTLVYYTLFLIVASCSYSYENIEIYNTNGIPSTNQSFSYMYFKNEYEGYLFGTYEEYLNLDEAIKNPKTPSKIKYERNVYKTTDGGHNWKKVAKISIKDGIFYGDNAIINHNNLYINTTNITGNDNFIDVFSFEESKIISSKKLEFDFFTFLEGDKDAIYSSTSNRNNKNNKIILYNSDFKIIDSINTNLNFSEGIVINNTAYTISRGSNKGNKHLYTIDKEGFANEINLSIYPENIIQINSDNILLAGNDKSDTSKVKFINHNINTGRNKVIKEVNNYTIVNYLQSNNKGLILAFIGNISGPFVSYDLIYSQDYGKTWTIKKLKENLSISPNHLINNTLYIYSSTKEIQKITL